MNIPAAQISYKKEIGHLGHDKLFGIGTVGGLHLVILAKNGGFETVGAGPHPALAKFLAKKKYQEIEYTGLEKSEPFEESDFKELIPLYQELTELFNG